jgi:hypothetical protein
MNIYFYLVAALINITKQLDIAQQNNPLTSSITDAA